MDQETVFVILLTVIYFLLFVASTVQLARILYYRHQLKSFQTAFLTLVFFWTLLRVIFFGETGKWPVPLILLLYWLPTDLQFATFSLLVVFFAYLLYSPRHWGSNRMVVLSLYALANITVLCLTAVYVGLGCEHSDEHNNCEITSSLDRAHHLYQSVQFLLLVLCYAYFAYRLTTVHIPYMFRQTTDAELGSGSTAAFPTRRLVIIALFVFVIFVSRCVYDFLASFSVYTIAIGRDDGGVKQITWLAFVLLVVWEVIPTVMILLYFRHIPRTSLGAPCPCPFKCCCCVPVTDLEESFGGPLYIHSPLFSTPTPGKRREFSLNTPESGSGRWTDGYEYGTGRSRSNSEVQAVRDVLYNSNTPLDRRYDSDDGEPYTPPLQGEKPSKQSAV